MFHSRLTILEFTSVWKIKSKLNNNKKKTTTTKKTTFFTHRTISCFDLVFMKGFCFAWRWKAPIHNGHKRQIRVWINSRTSPFRRSFKIFSNSSKDGGASSTNSAIFDDLRVGNGPKGREKKKRIWRRRRRRRRRSSRAKIEGRRRPRKQNDDTIFILFKLSSWVW